MKLLHLNILQFKILSLFMILTLVFSCDPKKYEEIPLSDLEPELKRKGELIVNDILESFNHKDGARYLLKKGYITPLVHGRIMHNQQMYKQAYAMIPLTLGEISKATLFQVIDKHMVKTMRYKLETDSKNMTFIEMKIDINLEYNLADFYLYVTSKDGTLKRANILPAYRK